MNTGIFIPVVNIVLALISIVFGIRTYLLIRHGLLGRVWALFILGAFFFAVMQLAATLMRSGQSDLGVVHDLASLALIVSFLLGSYLQFRIFTREMSPAVE